MGNTCRTKNIIESVQNETYKKEGILINEVTNSAQITSTDVIVVGAGMAGVACARKLKKNGLNVIVLEARARIGGRIHSEIINSTSVDLGAAFIHGACEENPLFSKY